MLADMHMHTEYSEDSCAKLDSMAEKAIAVGIEAICVTDHIDWDFPEKNLIFDYDVDAYQRDIARAKEKYKGRLEIFMGVELGMQPHLAERYQEFLKKYPFDFVIGSVHLVNNRDPYYKEAFEGLEDAQAYRMYFENILANIKAFRDFDSLGHLDYIVRYGKNKARDYSYSQFADIIDEILKELILHGKALEVNTAGYRKLGFPNPHPDVICRYRELGGEMITVGADAHKPSHVGYDFKKVTQLLKNCGFTHYTRFKDRKPEFRPL